ncbi:serine hydroxymethyltransferase [bacterium]|nr:serine hydroxymethyltransferase [bacterium]
MQKLKPNPLEEVKPLKSLAEIDPDVFSVLTSEIERETTRLQMIASENFSSRAVLEAQGSLFTNKYAEGYPQARYYQGCGPSDAVEQLAIDRVKELFQVDHANVQAHSGSTANMAAYMALLQPGDKVLGMDLADGGHLTHGAKFNFSGKIYQGFSYKVHPETHRIDYDALRSQAKQIKPRLIIAGASAYPRLIDFAAFRNICDEVGAYLLVDIAHIAGLVAGGVHPSPVAYADVITSTNHKTLRGPRGGFILCKQAYAKKVDASIFPGIQGGPLMHVVAAKAVAFHEALQPEFKVYTKQIISNAKVLSEAMLERGFQLITGGTDNHLILVDLRKENKTGAEVAQRLEDAGIVANKNGIPNDPLGPRVTSGIRLGVPAITSQGMKEIEMQMIAGYIDDVVRGSGDAEDLKTIREKVRELCNRFPIQVAS